MLLYSAPLSDTAKARLKAMLETGDGFEIARRDLAIRGPGEFLGARQSRRGAAALRRSGARRGARRRSARARPSACSTTTPSGSARHIERWLGARADYLNA